MPIYAYRCGACGLARDVLQKFSDPVLTVCPECGAEAFSKQVTAAGFQLKGSGWYVTDFRDGGNKAKASDAGDSAPSEASTEKPADAAAAAPAAPAAASAPAPAAPAPAASAAPATAKAQD